MIVTLHTQGLKTLAQVQAFVASNKAISFTLTDRVSAYGWMADTLKQFHYGRCTRTDKGVLRQYLCKVTGFSRAQVARCIRQFTEDGAIRDRRHAPAVPFARRYTPDDIRLLAEMDALHGTLQVHGDARFERLASISNGHLYNRRQHKTYQAKRGAFDKTRPTHVNIGERRKPAADGCPGYLPVDSVQQGDLDGIKGVYLINAGGRGHPVSSGLCRGTHQ